MALCNGPYFGSSNEPFSSLTTEYKKIVGAAVFSHDKDLTFTLNNLTIGKTYKIQIWASDSRGADRNESVSGSPVLSYNTGAAAGGLGEYIIGTFTADSTHQVLSFVGGSSTGFPLSGQINGLQLRTAPPEPRSTVLLMCPRGAGDREIGQNNAVRQQLKAVPLAPAAAKSQVYGEEVSSQHVQKGVPP